MSKVSTKRVKCSDCEADVHVPKWSANKQQCDTCKSRTAQLGVEFSRQVQEEPTPDRPVDKARHAQAILEALGFTITPRGWYKQYQDAEAVVRIEPYFDTGTPTEPGYALEGFTIVRQEFVAIVDRDLSTKLPSVAHVDITTLLQELEMKVPGVALSQTHVDTIICSKCGTKTAEWIALLSSKENLCVERCAGVKRPFGNR